MHTFTSVFVMAEIGFVSLQFWFYWRNIVSFWRKI